VDEGRGDVNKANEGELRPRECEATQLRTFLSYSLLWLVKVSADVLLSRMPKDALLRTERQRNLPPCNAIFCPVGESNCERQRAEDGHNQGWSRLSRWKMRLEERCSRKDARGKMLEIAASSGWGERSHPPTQEPTSVTPAAALSCAGSGTKTVRITVNKSTGFAARKVQMTARRRAEKGTSHPVIRPRRIAGLRELYSHRLSGFPGLSTRREEIQDERRRADIEDGVLVPAAADAALLQQPLHAPLLRIEHLSVYI
jgi:hypothetical protein